MIVRTICATRAHGNPNDLGIDAHDRDFFANATARGVDRNLRAWRVHHIIGSDMSNTILRFVLAIGMSTAACGKVEAPQQADASPCVSPSAEELCASLGKDCGAVAVISCGQTMAIECGDCTGTATCGGGGTANVCGEGACVPTTCVAEGYNCGTPSDECADLLDCGECSGDDTCGGGDAPYVCGSACAAGIDECGVCGGGNLDKDCAGTCFGTAVEDNCGTCDSDAGNDCTQDCAGVWGGTAVEDNCGTCDSDADNDCTQDCAGAWGGTAVEDNCGTCDSNAGNDCVQDCAGTWGGTAVEDNCGTCDSDAGNDCVQDCAGAWGGTAVEDYCGTCDSNPNNDCWAGEHGTMIIAESASFDIGSGNLSWSMRNSLSGYFYTSSSTMVASATAQSPCSSTYSGYSGLTTVQQLTNAASLSYSNPSPTLCFGTRASTCNQGLMVYSQGTQYGVIDYISIDAADNLVIEYWVGAPGTTDFSNAPAPF